MTIRYRELKGWKVVTGDGQERKLADILLDDRGWFVRYAVIDTGGWLTGRQILISSAVFGPLDVGTRALPISPTLASMEKSPPLEAHMPVTLAHERALEAHYRWPPPQVRDNVLPPGVTSQLSPDTRALQDRTIERATRMLEGERHLWGANALLKMKAQTRDGARATIDDIELEDRHWVVLGWMIDARPWLPGGETTLGPSNVESVDVDKGLIRLALERTEIEGLLAARANVAHARK